MDNKQAAKIISENLTSFYGYAFARLYDKNDVDDLTSEIVYELLRSSSRLSDESAFWAFAWKIAENTFRKFIRRKERSGKTEPLPEDTALPDTAPTPEEAYIERESAKESIFLFAQRAFALAPKRTARSALLITSITKPVPKLPKNSIFPSIW